MADIVGMDRWRIIRETEDLPNPDSELYKVQQCFVNLDTEAIYYDSPVGFAGKGLYNTVDQARGGVELARSIWIKRRDVDRSPKIPVIEYVYDTGEPVRV